MSPVVQALPSVHAAVLLAWAQPLAGLQESSVQTLPSSQLRGVPPTQVPALSQVSLVVQKLPSLHAVPFGCTGLEQTPVAEAQVPTA